jgi:hypothetical protein
MADIVLWQLRLGYGLDDRGVGERFPVITNISVLHNVQTVSGAHPIQWVPGAVSPEVKR